MADTLNRGYPYPLPTADPDVPYWLQRLAEDVDTDMKTVTDQLVEYQDGLAGGTTNSRYTRTRVGTEGFVHAHIVVALGSNALPANTNTGLLLVAGCVPAGFRAAYTIGMNPCVLSGMGRGDEAQYQIVSNGDLYLRSAGAAYSTTSGSSLIIDVTYRWNGSLVA